jgi:hypothetical protein
MSWLELLPEIRLKTLPFALAYGIYKLFSFSTRGFPH